MKRMNLNKRSLALLAAASVLTIGLGVLLVVSSPAYACPADGGGGVVGGFWDWIRKLF